MNLDPHTGFTMHTEFSADTAKLQLILRLKSLKLSQVCVYYITVHFTLGYDAGMTVKH